MKSDTPRTDEAQRKISLDLTAGYTHFGTMLDDFAKVSRQLERELNKAKALIQVYRNEIQTGKLERTRQQQILDALNNE